MPCTFSMSQPQMCSGHGVFVASYIIWKTSALCIISTSQLSKVLNPDVLLSLISLTSKSASRHNGVNFQECFQHEVSLALFDLQTCSVLEQPAIFDLSSDQIAPHPPLEPAYLSTSKVTIHREKHGAVRLLTLSLL